MKGYLVLETGQVFEGLLKEDISAVGEVVFNTSHSGYEEMATDPSYYNQILITTAPMQGNYGQNSKFWESNRVYIQAFVCLEVQDSPRDSQWMNFLKDKNIPLLTDIDTREAVLVLRNSGTVWGAVVPANTVAEAQDLAKQMITAKKKTMTPDWPSQVSTKTSYELEGEIKNGLKIACIDYGVKQNILRELIKRVEKIKVFPATSSSEEIKSWQPHGILLSNGPGDPVESLTSIDTVKELLGWRPLFGICMGHQILSLALGANTYKLKYGHRGSNHPIQDKILNQIYMTSQNHGYAVDPKKIPPDVYVTHVNLNDGTVAGIKCESKKCFSVQFHPESHPGPHEAESLFDEFIKQVI